MGDVYVYVCMPVVCACGVCLWVVGVGICPCVWHMCVCEFERV